MGSRTGLRSLLASMVALVGCGGSVIQTVPVAFGDAPPVEIDGLTPCTTRSTEPGELDPEIPLVVLVHGCGDSAGRFTALAEVFEAHGQQAVCFTYESRDTIDVGARRLARSLAEVEARLPDQPITLIGHSQGGLVSRRALTTPLDDEATLHADYELVTVSSPFAGIDAARHCGQPWLHGLSFGITVAICRGIAGRNWHEIHQRARLVEQPGELRPAVTEYLQIRTDERQSCRVEHDDGRCQKDDFVFSLDEQRNPRASGPGFRAREVTAGHVEIVGEYGVVPTRLIELLQDEGVMKPTPPEQRLALARLLDELYLDDT